MQNDEIRKKISEVEKELKKCTDDMALLGNVNIKLKSLKNMINKSKFEEQEKTFFDEQIRKIQKRYEELLAIHTADKKTIKNEFKESNLTYHRFDEESMSQLESNTGFYRNQNNILEGIISKGADSIESLRRQEKIFDSINNKLRQTCTNLGVSEEYIKSLEQRAFGDNTIFIIFVILIAMLIFLARIY